MVEGTSGRTERRASVRKAKALARRLSQNFGIERFVDTNKELSRKIIKDLGKITGGGSQRTSLYTSRVSSGIDV